METLNSNRFKVACIQMNTGMDISKNLDNLQKKMEFAANSGANLIVTPEQTLLMAKNKAHLKANIEYEDSDFGLRAIKQITSQIGVHVIIGSLSIKFNDKYALNRSYALDPRGTVLGCYDKIHMFDVKISEKEVYFESNTFKSGNKLSLVELPWGVCGLTICYDIRFPVLYRKLAQYGAKIITIPSAFTKTTGEAHWHVLLKARAIETGCFILAPAQIGVHENGRETYGHSLIVSPWGEILAEANINDDFIISEIDLKDVDLFRKKIPSINQNYDYIR